MRRQDRFNIVKDTFPTTQPSNALVAQVLKLMMGDCNHDGIVFTGGRFSDWTNSVLMQRVISVDPGIVDIDVASVVTKFVNDVSDSCVANIRTVLFEGQSSRTEGRKKRSVQADSIVSAFQACFDQPAAFRGLRPRQRMCRPCRA